MAWLPYSPDLKPIKNVSAMLKGAINAAHPNLITRKIEKIIPVLVEAVQEAWESLREEHVGLTNYRHEK
jgi:hypothetical protein